MARDLWSRALALVVALLIALAIIAGLILTGAALPIALLVGWLVSSAVCLGVGLWRRSANWATPGFIQLGGALDAALASLGIAVWWWPLGLVALGVVYLPLASLLTGRAAIGWRAALETSALFVAGVGAVWALGQVLTAYVLAAQGTPLLAEDMDALGTSFLLSSALLVGGALLRALLHRRLLVLALAALLLAQLAAALVIYGAGIASPDVGGLFALALLVVALLAHVGTYAARLALPDLAPGVAPRPWRLLLQRRGRIRAAQALKTLRNPEAWWLCVLLDGCALLLALLAIAPVVGQPIAGAPNGGPLLVVLTAGGLLSVAVAYWQQAPWLVLLTGGFLAADIYVLGLFATTPASTWPLLYFAATTGLLGLAVWLRSDNRPAWARPGLLLALGFGCLALTFALEHHSLAWGLGMALALAAAAVLGFWGWRMAQDTRQRP
ncbi:MAG TPA: hypothetical protein VH590_20700 [Ktedonobacterales bacterium]|jgi:hypothetical protein